MHDFFNSPWKIAGLNLENRLIQGPLAGFSCAPFRELFYQFTPPAYAVSEMISAHDLVKKHSLDSRYLYRAAKEKKLCYQIAGTEPKLMADAALRLESLGADLIDLNCGCPKDKIRKKGAGSALLENPLVLAAIVSQVRKAIRIPLTVKIRILGTPFDFALAKTIEEAGADALIVHGRRWTDDYEIPTNLEQIAKIKAELHIPVIANGDIRCPKTLQKTYEQTGADAFMISRAGTGKPWLYQSLLDGQLKKFESAHQFDFFLAHLEGLASLESEYKALLQARKLFSYYFRNCFNKDQLAAFYKLDTLCELKEDLQLALTSS